MGWSEGAVCLSLSSLTLLLPSSSTMQAEKSALPSKPGVASSSGQAEEGE